MTYNEQLQRLVGAYREAEEEWPATTRQIAAWAVRMGLWKPQASSMINRCAEDLAQAMREEYITDPQGRRVRAKHAARVDQSVFWADIRTASPQHMAIAFQQRRRQILGDCRQLKDDVDSFNENRGPSQPIQMVFDFAKDLLELEALRSEPAA